MSHSFFPWIIGLLLYENRGNFHTITWGHMRKTGWSYLKFTLSEPRLVSMKSHMLSAGPHPSIYLYAWLLVLDIL